MTDLVKLPREIMLLNQVATNLSEVQSIDTIIKIADQAEAYRQLGKKFHLAEEIVVSAAATKLKAFRRMGELLKKVEKSQGGRPSKNGKATSSKNRSPQNTGSTYKQLGINKGVGAKAQKIADIPAQEFNAYINRSVEEIREPTIAAAVRMAKQHTAKERTKSMPRHEGYVTRLDQLIEAQKVFSTIYADPPWRHSNSASRGAAENHYGTMSLEEIKAEPVRKLVGPRGHLHLWACSSMLPEALEVMAAWGFEYKSCFVWTKKHIGVGNYYRNSHEFLLFGDRYIGDDQSMLMLGTKGGEVFLDHSTRSWQEYPRRDHSQKPSEIRKMIETVSCGPFLEMYSREAPKKGWTHYGNQIVRS